MLVTSEGVLVGVVGAALGVGIDYALDGGQTALLLLGTVGLCALWGAIGVAVGAIVRNQVGAVIGLLAFAFVAENILFGLLPSVGRFGPALAGDGFLGQTTDHLPHAALGALVLAGWAVLLAHAGVALVGRRDVD